MNYRKILEILVGSMQIETEDLRLDGRRWQMFATNQIEAWATVLITKERLTRHQAMTKMFEAFEDMSLEWPTTAVEQLINIFYGTLGRQLNRL